MTISAIIFDAHDSSNEIINYFSKNATPRTLLKALRSFGTERLRYAPVIEINGKRFYVSEIHAECCGCHSVEEAKWFLASRAV